MNPLLTNQTSLPVCSPPNLPLHTVTLPSASQVATHLSVFKQMPSNIVGHKKRFQIFQEAQTRQATTNSEDEPTVVYNARKNTGSSVDFQAENSRKGER